MPAAAADRDNQTRRNLEALHQHLDAKPVLAVLHLVAVVTDDNPQAFSVEILGSHVPPTLAWAMLCAARQGFMTRYGFTDSDARQEAAH